MLRKSLPLVAALILALSAIAHAQESATAPQEGMRPGREGHREGKRHGRMEGPERLRFMSELNLTEEQRSQQRAIVQRHLANTKSQREELFKLREKRSAGTFTDEDIARVKVLRQEMHNSMQGIRTEMEALLTTEQRARLEQLQAERKARHEEMRERLRERREAVPR